jgi:erythromycin esterase
MIILLLLVVIGCAPLQRKAPSPARPPVAAKDDLSKDRRVAWLRAHAIPVRSVDPADSDFSDLLPLRQVIGNARIILLGEQTHDDGITFLAKTRLIKFLHREMGFDVLTWESGFYDVAKAWEIIEEGADPAAAWRRASFPIWTDVEETRALFEYVGAAARTTRPLALAGFDCQVTGTISRDFLVSDLRALLQEIGLDTAILDAGTPLAAGLGVMIENKSLRRATDLVAPDSAFVDALSELQTRIASAAAAERAGRRAFWAQLLTSLRQEALKLREQLASHDSKATKEERESAYRRRLDLRDAQMTENLLWLAREGFRGRKIIGWLASSNAMRSPDNLDTRLPANPRQGATPMGQRIWEAIGQEVYALGFTAYDLAAFEQAPKSDQSEEVEFEELMQATGLEYAIVDFRRLPPGGEWLGEPIISRPFANWGMKAKWPRVLDGMFYMREWKPATRIAR